jgi:2-hydroxychromene-2-carboxylate isomerase
MSPAVDYYFAPQSPWTYLGHERLRAIARRHGAMVRVKPIDLGGKVFPVSGGLPLGQRPLQRQKYRLVELERFSKALGMPLNLKPSFFPVAGDPAALLIVATDLAHGSDAAMDLTGRALRAVWAEERDISDPATRIAIADENGYDGAALQAIERSDAVQAAYAAYTEEAVSLGVFGAPTFVLDGERFWGQDRLDFVDRALAAKAAAARG